ncbi:SMC-Scp complex subunit ScpB [Mangrovibacillus cuniculi]|uniref:Segregation and condensation protein B n=1 Tax=Mangrovibacillus cuniculi TaxID=2593652 RepID=A0A7S8HFS4_9BACI|nr:SMC-Scp complex subunit ScpB [Mangrovibacillus cuniculi]QPC46745.1 SMC-Scp complex subunit ScpB [Mangrovibacillus cuniculi]
MEMIKWKAILESLLFAAGDEGLTLKQICAVMEMEESQASTIVKEMQEDFEADETRGLTVVLLAGTYQLVTKKTHSIYLRRLVESPSVSTLSQAGLETLAIIAYKQPITRVEIEQIRGVKTERPIQTLMAKGLIKDVGRMDAPGRPIMYGTTKEFLDYFNLKEISELPPLPDRVEEDDVQEEADLFFERFQETVDSFDE